MIEGNRRAAANITLSDLVASIDTDRHHGNLSSAIRLFVLDHYRTQIGDDAARKRIARCGRRARLPQFCGPTDAAG